MKTKYDYILIDDDALVRMTWEINAQLHKHNIKIYFDVNALKADLINIDFDTVFYIDSNLGKDENGEEVKGELLAQYLFETGFKKLYLATGHKASSFAHLSFIKGVINKEPPKSI